MSAFRKFRFLAIVGAIAVALCGALPAQSPNLLANADFEAGAWLGWNIFGNTFVEASNPPEIDPYSGQYCGKVFGLFSGPGAFSVSGIFQAFNCSPGESFELDSWTRHWSGDPLTGNGAPMSNWCVQRIAFFDNAQNEILSAGVETTVLDASFATDTWHYNAPVRGVAPAGAVSVQALILFLQPSLDPGAIHIDDVSFRRAWDLNLTQDPMTLDVTVEGINGIANAQWGAFYSFDPQNGTMPGMGSLGGLFIAPADVNTQLSLVFAGVPPFGGFLSPTGTTSTTIGGATFAPLSGLTLYGLMIQITPTGALDPSIVEGITFL